jgi:CBS domain-containing membrane protein
MFEGEVGHRLMERLRLARWLRRFPPRLVWAAFVFINGFIAVGLLATLALVFHIPFVFPSVGPTAFLLYFMSSAPTASPRNTLFGHAIGIGCGYAALWLTNLEHAPSAVLEELNWARVLAAALSLAATGALMILFRVVHPPAGATTLIVSLGIITAPLHLLAIEIAVAVMALQALAVNRLAGMDYPLWAKRRRPEADLVETGPQGSEPSPRGERSLGPGR